MAERPRRFNRRLALQYAGVGLLTLASGYVVKTTVEETDRAGITHVGSTLEATRDSALTSQTTATLTDHLRTAVISTIGTIAESALVPPLTKINHAAGIGTSTTPEDVAKLNKEGLPETFIINPLASGTVEVVRASLGLLPESIANNQTVDVAQAALFGILLNHDMGEVLPRRFPLVTIAEGYFFRQFGKKSLSHAWIARSVNTAIKFGIGRILNRYSTAWSETYHGMVTDGLTSGHGITRHAVR